MSIKTAIRFSDSRANNEEHERLAPGVIRAATAITRLGSGPIGWALLGMEAIYTALRAWHSRVVAEAKVTGWIARSIWGVGNPALRFNPAQELYEFFRLFQTPRVETDVAVVRSLLTTLPVVAGYRMISAGRLDPLPADARTLVVTLPGWQPQISAYRIAQHSGLRALTSAVTYDDPAKVTVRDGVGHVVIETGSLMGTTVVDYWPNGFTDPDSRYTVSN